MSHLTPERLSDVITGLYDAATERASWSDALGGVCALFDGSRACVVRLGPDLGIADTVATEIDPAFERSYMEEYHRDAGAFGEAVAMAPVGLVYSDQMLHGADTLRRSRFWNEWMAPQDMYGGLGCRLANDSASCWFFDVQRGRTQPAFDGVEAGALRELVPHLTRALQIAQRFAAADPRLAGVDRLPYGVLVLEADRSIVASNEAADAILDRAGGRLIRLAGRLTAVDRMAAAALDRLVVDACGSITDPTAAIGGDMLITAAREDDEAPALILSAGPLPKALGAWGLVRRRALVHLRDAAPQRPAAFETRIRTLFRLTPKEARLASGLAAGLTLKQVAEEEGIRFATARSYLEQVFNKTGVRQQTQLVALLAALPPAAHGN